MNIKTLTTLSTLVIAGIALTACNNTKANDGVIARTAGTQTTAQDTATPVQTTAPKAAGVWIDVRGADEYNAGHLQGALNITHEEIADKISAVEPDKSAPINLYCRSGRRAEMVRETLINLGYTNVTNHGGYDDLIKKGLR